MKTIILSLNFLLMIILFNAEKISSQWSSNPQVNLQICDVEHKQLLPKIASTSDGGCFISWFDQRGNGRFKVYIQRLNAQGIKQFASDGLLVSDKPQNTWIGNYDMKVDANDNALIVFSDIRNSGSDTIANPFAYKISSTGQFLWGIDGVTLTNNTTSYQMWPKVASLSDGSVIVVWWYFNQPQRNTWITMQRLNSSGVPQFANPINIQDLGGKRYQYPDVCAAENGNYIVSWVYGPKDTVGSFIPDNISIYTHKYNPSGGSVWNFLPAVYTNIGNHVPIYSVPKIQADGNGGALYSFFIDEGSVLYSRAQRINSSGIFLFPNNGADGSTNNQYDHVEPYLAYMNSTDETYIFWTEADAATQNYQGIFGQRFSSTGQRLWGNNGIGFTNLDTVAVYGITCFAKDTNVVASYSLEQISGVNAVMKAFRVGRSGNYSWQNNHLDVSTAASAKGFINGRMTPNAMTILTWIDGRNTGQLGEGGVFAQNINYNGTLGPVGISQISTVIPEKYLLYQNYPNPFNPKTTINYQLTMFGNVNLVVYDVLGNEVETLVNEKQNAGTFSVEWNAADYPSGIYFYKLVTGNFSDTKKMILTK